MKRKQPIALKTGNRVICWSEDYHRLLPVVVTKVNAKSFQGETSAGDKVNAISKLQAWSLKEFEKDYPEEFYQLYPHKRPIEETVNSVQSTDLSNSVITEVSNQVNDAVMQECSNATIDAENIDDSDNTINGHLPAVEKLPKHDFSVGDRITWQGGNFTIQKITAEAILILDADNFSTWIRDIKDIEQSNSWNPDDFGELEFLPEPDGQLNLLEPLTNEPPDPDDFADLNQYEAAWKAWKDSHKPVIILEENYTKEKNKSNEGVTNLRIDAIEVLEEMQPRMLGLNFETVNQYCDRIQNGEQPPPVIIYKIDGRNILIAGFHRVAAAKQAEKPYISAIIKQGTWAEAKLEAATNNKNNGLQMGNQDIGKAIGIYLNGLEELPEDDLRRKQSLREIGSAIGCSHTYVSKVKAQIAFEQKIKEFNLVKGARFKHKELGSCGAIVACYKTSESIILKWDINDGNEYTGQLSVNDFLKDFEPTDLPKQEAAPQTVNSVQKSFTKVENETKAKAKSLGLPTSKNGVFPDCDDNGDGKCLPSDRNTPPEMEAPTPGQYYEVKQERIIINPDDLVIGILSNVNQLKADHIKSLFDAIASRIPDELLIEEAQKRSAVSSAA